MTSERCEHLSRVLAEFFSNNLKQFQDFCEKVSGFDFMMGRSKSGFKASLTWALRQENILKILEGEYFQAPEEEKTPECSSEDVLKEIDERHGRADSFSGDDELSDSWRKSHRLLFETFGAQMYRSWFLDLEFAGIRDGILRLYVPSAFVRDHLPQGSDRRSALHKLSEAFKGVHGYQLIANPSSTKAPNSFGYSEEI